ncbi:BNR-4 repeat-containing protein [Catenovulum agarivorans]|uniref:BNR-4 repeat-containing protein n=1 Tax=Catenovulum agarivorans TaxID=1172192 RepID=UPI0002FAB9DF|nr:BNR-4 repeat-containing protein [Catenovulum agarivorans]
MKNWQSVVQHSFAQKALCLSMFSTLGAFSFSAEAAPSLEKEVHITDSALYFNGVKKASTSKAENEPDVGPHQYDYMYGRSITPHGDCIKTYKNFVFVTWYRGGKQDRKLMLTRYNTDTGTSATIEFPHRHGGYSNRWWVGETHNTIGLGLSPKDESIHMIFDQHSLSATNPSDGSSKNDYFKYYYSKPNSLTVPDEQFTLELFVKDNYYAGNDPINPYDNPHNEMDEYKHITLTGEVNTSKYQSLSYPKFSLTDEGDLYLLMRAGRSKNGAFKYNKYDGSGWLSSFKWFNYNQAQSRGNEYNYGVYGQMKFAGGNLAVGFQQRANISNDRYIYQNGFFGAYFDSTSNSWKNYQHETVQSPIINTDPIKIAEPGDLVTGDEKDRFSMVGGFDWNVTDRGDVHFIGKVVDTQLKKITYVHSYRKAGDSEFTSSKEFSGGEALYTAGKNIYLVGLKDGRPFVDRTEGGTNNFQRIYHQSGGRSFEKGVAYINNGKLYYYLLENHDGSNPDARSTYVQVIDLDLDDDTVSTKPEVSFPWSSRSLNQGYEQLQFKVNAQSPVEGRTVESVTLYINGEKVRSDNADPFIFGHQGKPYETGAMGWLDTHQPNPSPLPTGKHEFKAVAIDSAGEQSESIMMVTVNGIPKPPTISFPDPELTVYEGYEKLAITLNVATPEADRDIVSVTLKKDGQVIRKDTRPVWNFGHSYAPHEFGAMGWISCEQDPVPTPCHQQNPNPLGVGTHIFEAVAEDSEGLTSSAYLTLNVVELPAPVVSFNDPDIKIEQGYSDLAISANVETASDTVSIVSVGLYIDDVLLREVYEAPFSWGIADYSEELLGLTAGQYVLKAVATDSNNKMGESTILVEITAPALLGDLDSDGDVDRDDVRAFSIAVRTNSITDMVYDYNKDGLVNSRDVRGVALLCTRARCATE